MNEHSFIDAVHRDLPATSPDFLKWKINDRFAGGTADAYYASIDGVLWVEYKYLPNYPKRETTEIKLGLAKLQLLWLERNFMFCIPTAVIVGCENDALILTHPDDWSRTWTVTEFKKTAINRKGIARWIMKTLQQGSLGTQP